ncbi:MAG: rhamnulokinase [Spirochaetales bacterium]|nr:rhamnulokinase [Spirochaetales bacterium]
MKKFIAVDLGASNGRVIVGDLYNIEVVARFKSRPVRIRKTVYWDFLGLMADIREGLRAAFEKYGDEIVSIGFDTWGVDYALLDANGDLLSNPFHYRDNRTDGMMEEFFKIIPKEDVYNETGIQFMQINTLFQIFAHNRISPETVKAARHFLTVPDLLNYWLTGVMKNEFSEATTTQLYNPVKGCWSEKLIKAAGFDPKIFGDIVLPGTVIGKLLPEEVKSLGAGPDVVVTAAACHDTASAVAAVPAAGGNFAYLSSGTWSLLGIELDKPVINDLSYKYNFTNEGGREGSITYLKNIMGLWIIQECKAHWDKTGEEYDWPEIVSMAEEAGDRGFSMDPDDTRFLKSNLTSIGMPLRIQEYCREEGLPVPETIGEIAACVFRSLAEKYAVTVGQLEESAGVEIESLYIIGGGCQNELLCRWTAEAVKVPVFAGPVEATAIGNILIQAISAGEVASYEEGRKLIAANFEIKRIDYKEG